MPVAFFLVQCLLLGQPQTNPQTASPDKLEWQRLIATGKLWATVKYFHPYVAYREIDWDKALVDALPKIRSAATGSEYAVALGTMLDALHDPATYTVLNATGRQNDGSVQTEKRPDGTLVVSQQASSRDAPNPVQQLLQALPAATKIVFDLRVQPGESSLLSNVLEDKAVTNLLARTAIETAAQRTWVHNGLPAQFKGNPASGYYAAFLTKPGVRIEGGSAAADLRVAFILNENSPLPWIGCALLAEGKAQVFSETTHFQFADTSSTVIPMGQDVSAMVRLSEPLASRQVKVVTHEAALDQALASLGSSGVPAVRAEAQVPVAPVPRPDLAYSDLRYPSAEFRILAAYKTWAAFHNFFAYRDLMDEDWDEVFATFLPRFIAAKNAREYNLTLAEMVTHTADSHAVIESAEMTDYFGGAPVGLRLRLIEKKPVITEVLDPAASKVGIRAGDVVTKVDGESITERFHREERYISGSTTQALGYALMQRILNGPDGSEAVLSIQDQEGQTREARLKRSTSFDSALAKQRTGDVVKILPGNIGYVDLDRLLPEQVDPMFEKLRSTPAIIFDARGNPHGTAWSIAQRLTERQDVAAAIFNGPLSLGPDLPSADLSSSASYFFVQKLPSTDKWKYLAKTVMLIDERTIGQAEHTGLFLEAANKTEFIGTVSAGAVGDVTNFVIPGGITVSLSGHDVRHANGGALQRLGLEPAVSVPCTIQGIRSGVDEVLQKAIEYLSPASQKASLSPVGLGFLTSLQYSPASW